MGESFNFGPRENLNYSVLDVLKEIKKNWKNFKWKKIKFKKNKLKEAKLLSLNCKKVNKILKWKLSMNFSQTIKTTIEWYKNYYNKKENAFLITSKQIKEYQKKIEKF
jgi:dTDP-D-glucose 4,6-dehydratase